MFPSCALATALFLCVGASALCGGKPAPAAAEAGSEVQSDWILRQMQKDMMYGSDDFFGEDTDLSFVDALLAEGRGGLSRELTPGDADRDHQFDARPPDPEPPPDEEPPPV